MQLASRPTTNWYIVRPFSITCCIYVRGNKRDYDFWAVDNPGWSYDEVLPYFIKLEDNRNPYIAVNTKYHGTGDGGYLTVQERSRIAVYNATCDHIC